MIYIISVIKTTCDECPTKIFPILELSHQKNSKMAKFSQKKSIKKPFQKISTA